MWQCTLTENLRQSSQMDSWKTVFVFRDRCVERVDTPALEMLLETYASETDKPADRAAVVQERPMELDRAQAKKERIKAYNKAYKRAHRGLQQAYTMAWRQRNHGCVECRLWPDWRVGLPHYDSHCYRCFSRKFPDHAKVRTKERAEDTVKAYINSHFKDFVHDQKMPTAHCNCNHLRQIDHRRVVGNTLLCVETDEHHHRNYDAQDEDARYHDVMLPWGGRLAFIRFNPDPLSRNDEGPPLEERLERLHSEITRHIGRLERGENSAYLEVWHLYYPEGTSDYYEEALAPEGL